jgi:hypothetical protein
VRDLCADVARASAATDPVPGEIAGAVLEVGGEHLVTPPEVEGARGEVDPGRRVLDEGEIGGGTAEIGGERCPCAVEEAGEAASQKVDRLPLELALPGLVGLEDRTRAGAERTVVEEGDLGVEEILAAELGRGRCGHGPLLLHPKPPPTRGQVKRAA